MRYPTALLALTVILHSTTALAQQTLQRTKDLFAKVPTGKEHHTYLRAILLVADHNAYHLGQIVAVRRALGAWG